MGREQRRREKEEVLRRDEDEHEVGKEQTKCERVQSAEETALPVLGRHDSGEGARQRPAEGGDGEVCCVVQDARSKQSSRGLARVSLFDRISKLTQNCRVI